jgi:hypothetical protein
MTSVLTTRWLSTGYVMSPIHAFLHSPLRPLCSCIGLHSTRLYPSIDNVLKTIQTHIVASGASFSPVTTACVGRLAAFEKVVSRTDDGINNFVDYGYGPLVPGVYQVTNAEPST